jgi:hypothetical protein
MSYSFVCSDPEIMATAKETKIDDDIPDEVRLRMKQARLNLLREERNKLLIDTDKYIIIPDIPDMNPEKIEELKVYRQELRDYMNNLNVNDFTGLSCDIIPPYPTKPTFLK